MMTGLQANLLTLGVGLFGMTLTLIHGIQVAIDEVKVPQLFHGRMFALHSIIA